MRTISRKAKTLNRPKRKSNANPEKRAIKILDITKASLENDKAQDIVVINLAGKTSFADYMVIATGTSQRQVAAMAVHLKEKMKLTGQTEISLEGTDQNDWVLIDSGDVVVHLFRPEIREFYALEKIWSGEMPQSDEVA